MKYQILAGTLGLVLLLGMSPLPQAEAKIFIIDDFVLDPNGLCDIALLVLGTSSCQQSGLSIANVIGGVRDSSITLDVANAPSNGVIDYVGETDDGAVGTSDEMFRHMAGTGVETISVTILAKSLYGAALSWFFVRRYSRTFVSEKTGGRLFLRAPFNRRQYFWSATVSRQRSENSAMSKHGKLSRPPKNLFGQVD